MSLEFKTDWIRPADEFTEAAIEAPEDEATLAGISVMADDICLTRAEDTETGYIRNHAVLPAYRIAEWFAWNWWRLRWEPRRQGQGRETALSWAMAHHMAAIGDGWLWPNISFNSDGFRIVISTRPSHPAPAEPLRYIADQTVVLPATMLETCVDCFARTVMERLDQCRISATDFQVSWGELNTERANPEISAFRKVEALLGCDPDDADPELVEKLLSESRVLGQEAVTEVAASGEEEPMTAERLQQRCRMAGFDTRPRDGVQLTLDEDSRPAASRPAWRVGAEAARRLRYEEHLDGEPVRNPRLTELCAVEREVLDREGDGHMAFELDESEDRGRVVLRSRWEANRRFDLARLLGDRLLSTVDENLHPATASNTYRQKMQRAFAAEFLCPIEALQDHLNDDFSDEAQQDAAQYFQVSSLAVATLLANNGYIDREDIYDPDTQAA